MEISEVLKKLDLPNTGRYENQFYILPIEDSNEYAKIYTKLDERAVNTEFPNFSARTDNAVTKVTNYFELATEDSTFLLFLIGNLDEDTYYLKITEKK